jgi:hypothetical protein
MARYFSYTSRIPAPGRVDSHVCNSPNIGLNEKPTASLSNSPLKKYLALNI